MEIMQAVLSRYIRHGRNTTAWKQKENLNMTTLRNFIQNTLGNFNVHLNQKKDKTMKNMNVKGKITAVAFAAGTLGFLGAATGCPTEVKEVEKPIENPKDQLQDPNLVLTLGDKSPEIIIKGYMTDTMWNGVDRTEIRNRINAAYAGTKGSNQVRFQNVFASPSGEVVTIIIDNSVTRTDIVVDKYTMRFEMGWLSTVTPEALEEAIIDAIVDMNAMDAPTLTRVNAEAP